MKLIVEKKINSMLVGLVLYLSFCLSSFYLSRGEWGYSSSTMLSLTGNALISNVYVAFFAGGLAPFLIYEVITSFSLKMMKTKFIFASDDLRYSLRFFYIGANLVIAALSLLYLISPLVSVYGNIFIPFIVTSVFFALFIMFAFKHYIDKSKRGVLLMNFGGVYIIFYAFIALLNLVGAVQGL